jgi:hypothetical protein
MRRYSASVRVGDARRAMGQGLRRRPPGLRENADQERKEAAAPSLGGAAREPVVDPALEHVQRQRALLEHDLMERAQVEGRA